MLASYLGLHFYAARWLARSFSLAAPAVYWLRLALLSAAFLSPLTMFLKRHYHGQPLEMLYAAAYAWMGIILVTAFIFACSDLAALLLRRADWLPPRAYAWGTLAVLAGVLCCGIYCGQRIPRLKPVNITFKDLPPQLDGFRIAQISDMHLDSGWKLRKFAAIVEEINSAAPDLVLVTGDLLDPGLACDTKFQNLAGGIKSRLGVYGSLGNHEYYYGLQKAEACYARIGIKLLVNSAMDADGLRLIGLADIHTAHMTREDVLAVLKKYEDGKFNILMSHQPVFYKDIAAVGDYMVFSGHTHKGQIFPFHIFTKLFYPYFYGLYRIGASAFYVTSGAGTWGPPLRWLAPAEIPLITLRAAK